MTLEVFSTLMIPWFSQYLFNLICLVSMKLYLGLKGLRISQVRSTPPRGSRAYHMLGRQERVREEKPWERGNRAEIMDNREWEVVREVGSRRDLGSCWAPGEMGLLQ